MTAVSTCVHRNLCNSVIKFAFFFRHHHPEKLLNHSGLGIALFYVLAQHWAAISAGTRLMVTVVSCAVKPNTTAQSARPICALCHAFKSTMNGNLLGAAERRPVLSHPPSWSCFLKPALYKLKVRLQKTPSPLWVHACACVWNAFIFNFTVRYSFHIVWLWIVKVYWNYEQPFCTL